MVDTLTSGKTQLHIQSAGSNNNTWGDVANGNFTSIDAALSGITTITTTGGTTTLTQAQEQNAVISVSGTLVSNATIVFSGRGGFWIVDNNTTGNFSLTCKLASSTGTVVAQGSQPTLFCTGTDIVSTAVAATIAEATVSAASTTDILSVASPFIAINGNATITSLGTTPNTQKFVRILSGSPALVHNGTSLILPGQRNLAAASGDTFIAISDASGNVRIYAYQAATGKPVTSSYPVGAISAYVSTSAPPNWLMMDGKSVGNSGSGATALVSSSADTFALFSLLWNVSNLSIQDSGGNSSTRTTLNSDWTNNKRILLPDARGRVLVHQDGGAGRATGTTGANGLDATGLCATGGAQGHFLTVAELATHSHTLTDPGHTHAHNSSTTIYGGSSSVGTGTGVNSVPYPVTAITNDTATTGITLANSGSGSVHNNIQPSIVLNYIIYAGVP